MSLDYNRLDRYLEPLMVSVRHAEEFLGPDDDWVEDDRRIAYEVAQRLFGDYHTFITEKKRDDYFTTAHVDSDAVEVALDNAGYDRNLASKRGYRTHHDGGKQWAVGAYSKPVAASKGLQRQHHVYLFEAPNSRTDIYGHTETSVVEGAEHLTEMNLIHGDPLGLTFDALDKAHIDYSRRNV